MNLKKILLGVCTFAVILAICCTLVTNDRLSTVQQQVIKNYSEIENIVSINRIGSWGEWFSEYVLVVEIDGEAFRIWINTDGEIIEKEALRD